MATGTSDSKGPAQFQEQPTEDEELLRASGTSDAPNTIQISDSSEAQNGDASDLPSGSGSLFVQVQQYYYQTLEERKPWQEFYSTRDMSLPAFSAVSDRVTQNMATYKGNYLIVALVVFAVLAIQDLMGILVFGAVMYLFASFGKKRFVMHGPGAKKSMAQLAIILLFCLWVTGVGALIGATLFFAGGSCLTHAMVRNPQRTEFEIEPV